MIIGVILILLGIGGIILSTKVFGDNELAVASMVSFVIGFRLLLENKSKKKKLKEVKG